MMDGGDEGTSLASCVAAGIVQGPARCGLGMDIVIAYSLLYEPRSAACSGTKCRKAIIFEVRSPAEVSAC